MALRSLTNRKLFLTFLGLWIGFVCAHATHAATLVSDGQPFSPYADEFATAIVMVPKTHQVLYAFKPDVAHVPASLTKLANALAFIKLNLNWNKVVTLKRADEVGGGRLRVPIGTKLSIRDLFYASITASANNAATALARISGLSVSGFVSRMNLQARLAGAKRTRFYDASGMNPKNTTTARDMALIAEKAFSDPRIHSAATSPQYTITLVSAGGQPHPIKSTDALLTTDNDVWVVGGKTGYLPESGYNLAVEVRPTNADGTSDPSKELIIVVMGSRSSAEEFATAKRLAVWAWNNHEF